MEYGRLLNSASSSSSGSSSIPSSTSVTIASGPSISSSLPSVASRTCLGLHGGTELVLESDSSSTSSISTAGHCRCLEGPACPTIGATLANVVVFLAGAIVFVAVAVFARGVLAEAVVLAEDWMIFLVGGAASIFCVDANLFFFRSTIGSPLVFAFLESLRLRGPETSGELGAWGI